MLLWIIENTSMKLKIKYYMAKKLPEPLYWFWTRHFFSVVQCTCFKNLKREFFFFFLFVLYFNHNHLTLLFITIQYSVGSCSLRFKTYISNFFYDWCGADERVMNFIWWYRNARWECDARWQVVEKLENGTIN